MYTCKQAIIVFTKNRDSDCFYPTRTKDLCKDVVVGEPGSRATYERWTTRVLSAKVPWSSYSYIGTVSVMTTDRTHYIVIMYKPTHRTSIGLDLENPMISYDDQWSYCNVGPSLNSEKCFRRGSLGLHELIYAPTSGENIRK